MSTDQLSAPFVVNNCSTVVGEKTCLTKDTALGLAFVTEAGFISLLALVSLMMLVARNALRHKRHDGARWKLVQKPVDIYVLCLMMFDVFQAIGALMNSRWVQLGYTEGGAFCSAQGALKHWSQAGVAFMTMAIAIHTLITLWTHKGGHRLDVAIGVSVATLVFVTMYVAIASKVAQNNGKRFYAPDPYWCWIGKDYRIHSITGQYLWLWLAVLVSIVVYIPLFLWSKGFITITDNNWRSVKFSLKRIRDEQGRLVHVLATHDKLAVGMLAYPLSYSFCVLPLSITRWIYFAGNHPVPTGALFFANFTFNLFGALNVLLLLTTRPGLLALNSPLVSPYTAGTGTEQKYRSRSESAQISLRSTSHYDNFVEFDSPSRTRSTLENDRV